MTQEEYAGMPIVGWHEVCRDVDGAGGVGVRFLGDAEPVQRLLFDALKDMAEFWAYGMAKPPGAKPSPEDEMRVERIANAAITALHAADPSYVHNMPRPGGQD